MFDTEKSIAQAGEKFNAIKQYVVGEGQQQDAYTVEKHIFQEALAMCLHLMSAYFDTKQGGDVGEGVETDAGDYLPRERLKEKRFVCIFGELALRRWYYHEDNIAGVFPLDEDVNLSERCYSYYVQELLQERVGRMTYDEVIGELHKLFNFAPYKHTIEDMAEEAACDQQSYYEQQPAPAAETEAGIVVAALDGKGVPIVKDEPSEHKPRLSRGEKRSRKKEAIVSAVYTIEPHVRTADDIVGELCDNEPQKRPKPQNKHVRATMAGKDDGFKWTAQQMRLRDPEATKQRVCLMDGSAGLWTHALEKLEGCTFILDIFHVLEYLWKAAYVFHPEGSDEAAEFVRKRLRMLLEGKVGYLIGGLRQMLVKHRKTLSSHQCKALQTVINYYDTRRQWMRYDEYIAAGYPIGSGAAEGACRHLVKDRMEGSGMRWTVTGAQSVLTLRAMNLSGQWDSYWAYHMQKEKARRFGHRKWRPLDGACKAA